MVFSPVTFIEKQLKPGSLQQPYNGSPCFHFCFPTAYSLSMSQNKLKILTKKIPIPCSELYNGFFPHSELNSNAL